ncbi:MAG: RidA family protein [Sphingomonadales bacterium]
MTGSINSRLGELGIRLPEPPNALANYAPYVIVGNLVQVSGQIPIGPNGLEYTGKVGVDISLEEARKAARLCAINLVAQARHACGGDLDRVRRVVKLGGFVSCTDGFDQHPGVINAASDLMVDIFGDIGRHARFAVGANSLPLNAAVEIDGIFEIA